MTWLFMYGALWVSSLCLSTALAVGQHWTCMSYAKVEWFLHRAKCNADALLSIFGFWNIDMLQNNAEFKGWARTFAPMMWAVNMLPFTVACHAYIYTYTPTFRPMQSWLYTVDNKYMGEKEGCQALKNLNTHWYNGSGAAAMGGRVKGVADWIFWMWGRGEEFSVLNRFSVIEPNKRKLIVLWFGGGKYDYLPRRWKT
jgi:hypothetical protein